VRAESSLVGTGARAAKYTEEWNLLGRGSLIGVPTTGGLIMDGIIYLVGVIVIVMAILSFFGLR
jgi:hypothetical protein